MCVSRALLSAAKGHLTATILPNDSCGDDAHRSHRCGLQPRGPGRSVGGSRTNQRERQSAEEPAESDELNVNGEGPKRSPKKPMARVRPVTY